MWLAVEHDNARLRGKEAADASLGELRRGFVAMIADTAREVLPRLIEEPHATPEADLSWPPIVAEAFLIDGTGRAAGPRPGVGTGPSAASGPQPAALLAAGAQAISAGRLAEADQTAALLLACCGDARDEFGVAYATYAAWQRLKVDGLRPDPARSAAVVGPLRELIGRGDLTQAADLVSLRLLRRRRVRPHRRSGAGR